VSYGSDFNSQGSITLVPYRPLMLSSKEKDAGTLSKEHELLAPEPAETLRRVTKRLDEIEAGIESADVAAVESAANGLASVAMVLQGANYPPTIA
jgi:hypothetical protein